MLPNAFYRAAECALLTAESALRVLVRPSLAWDADSAVDSAESACPALTEASFAPRSREIRVGTYPAQFCHMNNITVAPLPIAFASLPASFARKRDPFAALLAARPEGGA